MTLQKYITLNPEALERRNILNFIFLVGNLLPDIKKQTEKNVVG